MEGDGDCLNIFPLFPATSLKLQESKKKSLCAVKHANGRAGKNRQARYYLDFISHSVISLSIAHLFLSVPSIHSVF